MFVQRSKFSAYTVFLILEATSSLFFAMIFTIAAVYRVTQAGLNPLQLVLVGTALEGTTFIFQIPTGLLADIYSRRLSIILGIFLMGIAFIIEGSFPLFLTIIAAQVLRAIGAAFATGAEEAWIADEMGEKNIAHLFLRGSQAGFLGTVIGTLLSVVLASFQLNLPFIVGGILFLILGFFLIFTMPEKNFQRRDIQEQSNPWQAMKGTVKESWELLRLRPILLTILCVAAFYGMASEGFDRLWPDHFLTNFTFPVLWSFKPIVWFGIISGVATLLSIVSTEVIRKRVDTSKHVMVARTLFIITILLIIALIIFGLAGNFYLALIAYWFSSSLRQTQTPIYTAWLVQHTDSRVRATVLSASSQFDALGQVVGGPIVGAVGTIVSLRAAMVFVGGILSPALVLFATTIRRSKANQAKMQENNVPASTVIETETEIVR